VGFKQQKSAKMNHTPQKQYIFNCNPGEYAECVLSWGERQVHEEVWALAVKALFLSIPKEFTSNIVHIFRVLQTTGCLKDPISN